MITRLEFQFGDEDGMDAHLIYANAARFYFVLCEFDGWLRNEIKYGEKPYQKVRDQLRDLMLDNDISTEMVE
jgi:hypothetical protein